MKFFYHKKNYFTFYWVVLFFMFASLTVRGQFSFSDNASNYSGSWANNNNQGTGYNAWSITTSGNNSGTFIGDPSIFGMETVNLSTTAFGLYGHSSNYVNAIRYFGNSNTNIGMQIGDTYSFYWAMNYDTNSVSGSKGFDLRSGSDVVFNVNNSNSPTIFISTIANDAVYGVKAMLVTLTRISATQYTFTMTSRSGGAAYSITINSSSSIDNINIYCSAQDGNQGERNIYFNSFNFTKASPYLVNTDVTDPRILSGGNNLLKSGTGTLTLTAQNTFTGLTTVAGGVLQLNKTGGGTLPSTNDIIVNSGGTLKISSNQIINNLTLAGTLLVDAGVTLTINGTYSNTSGTIENNGGIVIGGASTSFPGTSAIITTIKDLTISSPTTIDKSVTITGALLINSSGILTITPNTTLTLSGTTDFGGKSVIIKSDVTGTGSIGQVTGTPLGAANVTIERYIPAKRAWRLLTAPLKGTTSNTITSNWQGVSNEGLLLFSPATYQSQAMTGYSTGGSAPNIFKFVSGSWQSIPNLTTEPMYSTNDNNTNAYLVFSTGPSDSTNIASGFSATTLRPKGQIITGTVTYSLTANQYALLPNPYASPISTEALIAANSGSKIWLMDPSVSTVGGYVTYDGSNWAPSTPPASEKYIQSGQGFFVKSTNTSFVISETNKISGNSNTWFERASSESMTEGADKIRVLLYKQEASNWKLADGILAVNFVSGNSAIDDNDVNKMSNFGENIMFRNGTSNVSIEYRGLPQVADNQAIRLTGTTEQPYQLRLFAESYNNSSIIPLLEDTVTGTFTSIPVDGTLLTVPFSGASSSNANPDNRFRIVYQSALSNPDFSPLWVSTYPNPVRDGLLQIHLNTFIGVSSYAITNLLGQEVQQGILESAQNEIILNNLTEGFYLVSIIQAGKHFTTKIYVQ